MEVFEQASYIHSFLDALDKQEKNMSLVEALNRELSYTENNFLKYEKLRLLIEKFGLALKTDWKHEGDTYINTHYEISELGYQLIKDEELTNFILAERFKEEHPELYDDSVWNEYFDKKIEKRINQADFFFDIIVSESLVKLDKPETRKYFKEWFKQTQEFDLQIKNGDLAIEDGDLQIVPDFDEENIPDFIKWFNERKDNFLTYLENYGVTTEEKTGKQIINNSGNFFLNQNSDVQNQSIKTDNNKPDTIWTKMNVIIALIVGIATIIGVLWSIMKL